MSYSVYSVHTILFFIVVQVLTFPPVLRRFRSPEVLAIIDQARALPAEFHADVLLRIVQSPLVHDAAWKQELVEEAYWSGAHAFLPYLQYAAEGRSDSVATDAVRANGLEALTLQSKAVQAMLPLNSGHALKLFQLIEPLNLPTLSCSTIMTPNLDIYYQTAGALFQRAFTPAQQAGGEDELLLQQVVGAVEVPAQVPDAIELIFAVPLAGEQRRELLSLLAARLQEISRSDREYGAAEPELVKAIDRIQPSDAAVLVPALRAYIVRHVSGRRCTDNMLAQRTMPRSTEAFNSLAAKLDPTHSRYQPISPEEAKPNGFDGTYQQNLFGQSGPSQAITEALRWLTHGNRVRNGKLLRWTTAERSTRKWLRRYDDVVEQVHDFKETDEPSLDAFFCAKADFLDLLATLPPPGARREAAMQDYREFMEEYYPSVQNPNLWFTMLRHMLYTARFSEDAEERAWILSELARSSNPIVVLYANLEIRIGSPISSYPVPGVPATSHVLHP